MYLSPIGEKNKEYHAFLKDDYVVPDWSAGVIPKTVIRICIANMSGSGKVEPVLRVSHS